MRRLRYEFVQVNEMTGVSYNDITMAAQAIRGHLVETPQARSVNLSILTGADIVSAQK